MNNIIYQICKKETASYFESPQAWIILSTYILISMFTLFFIGGFFSINNTGLFSFFYFQSYIFAFIIPAVTMKLWAEERKSGTLEFLLTQPIPLSNIVMGKFLSAWFLCLCMLALSLPLWIMMNMYFDVDNLNILSGYLGCILLSGAFCGLGCMVSSICSSSAVSYLLGMIVLLGINLSNFAALGSKLGLPDSLAYRLQNSLNLDTHYYDFIIGQISLDNVAYFVLLMILGLTLNLISIEYKKD